MQTLAKNALDLFWRTNKATTLFFFATFLFLAIGIIGMVLDPRQVLNAPTWAKDVKFSLSLALYTPTMLWMFSYIKFRPRLKSFLLTASAAILFLEMVMIVLQAARAVPMHFNVSTPFDAALWSAMSVSILVFYLISIIGFILFLRQPIPERTLAWSMKLGMAIMLVGFGVAFLMTGPQPDQLAQMQNGIAPAMIGAHTVGAPEGGPGLPLLGWSTRFGDLRIAHFIGIHGPQALALFGFGLIRFSRRRNNRLTETHRLWMVVGAFLTYLGLVALVTLQALRMQPITAPDASTLTSVGALLIAFITYNTIIIAHAYRPTNANPAPISAQAH